MNKSAAVLVGLVLFSATENVISQATLPVDLGAASTFGVLAGAGVTITGASTINGDLGSFPTVAITGLENLTLNGVNHGADLFTQNGKSSLSDAYNDAAGRTASTTYLVPVDFAGLTLLPGVYKESSSIDLNGTLTLNAQGDPSAIWIFQAGSTLTTGTNSSILLTGGAQAANIFWQVGSSATLGTGSNFAGNILALTSISLETGATVNGRVLAQNGAVTMQSNLVGIPEPAASILCMSVLLGVMRRRRPVAVSNT